MNYSVHVLGDRYAREVISILKRFIEENTSTLLPDSLDIPYYMVIQHNSSGLPGFVLTEDDRVIGFGYCTPYHEAASLKHTAEVHAYVHDEYLRKGLGSVLMEAMVESLRSIGITALIAGCLPQMRAGSRSS